MWSVWWNRGLRRRDHTNQVHKYNLGICLGTNLMSKFICNVLQWVASQEVKFYNYERNYYRLWEGFISQLTALNNREIWLWHSRPSLWVGEKKSTYKSGLTLLHSHRETQVAEERIKVNGVPACADTKVAGNLNRTPRNRNDVKVAMICYVRVHIHKHIYNVCND